MYGYMYIYNIFLYWIYIYKPDIYIYTWSLGVCFLFYRVYITSKILRKNRTLRILPIKGGVINGVTGKYIYIYVYMHICCFYMELGFHFSILELYGNIKSFILEESNFEHVDFFLFVFSPAIVFFYIIILSPRKWIRIIQRNNVRG